MNKRGDSELLVSLIVSIIVWCGLLCMLLYRLNIAKNEQLDLKKCKLIEVTNLQAEEVFKAYGTNVNFDEFKNKIDYTYNGEKFTFNLSHQENSIIQIEEVDMDFCK